MLSVKTIRKRGILARLLEEWLVRSLMLMIFINVLLSSFLIVMVITIYFSAMGGDVKKILVIFLVNSIG